MGWFLPLLKVAGPIIAGALSSRASGDAADQVADASAESNALQQYMYDQNRADLAPYRNSGYNALNALNRAMGLPQVGLGDPNAGRELFGGGDRPMTEDELREAYRLVLNREADPSGLNYYMTGGPKVDPDTDYLGRIRGSGRDAAETFLKSGSAFLSAGSGLRSLFGGDDDRVRRSYTFNEFLNATLGSDEYKQKLADGTIEAWDSSRLQPQQEFLGGSETNPDDRYGGFYESPGYQFSYDQAMKGAERAASAGGYLPTADEGLSGRFSKEMSRYSQGLASQEFGNYINRLAGIAGTGQTATTNTAFLGQNYANSAGAGLMRAGDARASGIIGRNNAWANAATQASEGLGEWWGNRT